MRIELIGKDYNVSDRLKEILEKKIGKLDKFFGDDAKASIVCKKESDRQTMEVSVKFGGKIVRSEVTSENMYDNIDVILPKITKQIEKHRTKLSRKLRPDAFVDVEEIVENKKVGVAREKKFELIPMTVEDAITELDLLGHDFYLFINVDTGKVGVVYKRTDGKVGLLSPEY